MKADLEHCSSPYVCRRVDKVSGEAGFLGKKKQKTSLPWRTNSVTCNGAKKSQNIKGQDECDMIS